MAKPNITYFLGAGASCNKLPTIANISDKIEYLRNHISTIPIDTHYHTLRNQLLHSLKITAEESKRFNTVDTYARKLYLNGTSNKLLELKAALSVCFIYWQLYDGRSKEHKPSPNIDHRYISLISSFLEKDAIGNLYIPNNIKFITWNYDMQLELALQYFSDSKSK